MAGGTGRSNRSLACIDALHKLSLWNLAEEFDGNSYKWPKKIAAEVAFALAVAIKREADRMGEGFADKKIEYTAKAKNYARQCIALAKELPADTMADVATSHTSLVGVGMPNYFYAAYITNKRFFPAFAALLE